MYVVVKNFETWVYVNENVFPQTSKLPVLLR